MSMFAEFKYRFEQDENAIWRQIFADNKDIIKIKKEKFALRNLQIIITSTIELSNRTGFNAMSLRDLSNHAGISMGALYSYIESKKRLMEIILVQVLRLVDTTLGAEEVGQLEPLDRLRWLLRNHIFLTEVMQPWFFFAYMEAKSFDRVGKRMAIANELRTEGLIASCLADGERNGVFRPVDPIMTASLIKPLLQDWYLKRWKYNRRGIGPEVYAEWVINFVDAFLHQPPARGGKSGSRARKSDLEEEAQEKSLSRGR
jgi:TetR/AcrR family transcriptional regulator, cholesterol catabolism regulator